MPRILLILCALPLALALAACGGEEESGSDADATSTTSAPRQLTIVYTADEGAQPRTIEVTCDGDATGADAESERINAAICGALETEAGLAALEQPPDGQACTMIFGGPQKAEISGTVDGSPVETTITRANGCEIARWEALFGGSFTAAPSDDVKAALTVLYTPEEGAGPQKFEVTLRPRLVRRRRGERAALQRALDRGRPQRGRAAAHRHDVHRDLRRAGQGHDHGDARR